MGQAKQRGTFEQRKTEAIKAGRLPEVRRKLQAEDRANRRATKQAYLEFLRKMQIEYNKEATKSR